MARARGTDGSLLSSLPWTLGALSLSFLPHLPYLPIWITAAFFGCASWRYIIERQRRPLPSSWFRAALALGCFLGVLATYSSISGVGPGSALLAVMASLKLLETRKRRDQFVLLFIAIFMVMSSLLREQFLWSLPYMLVALTVIMTAWLRMSAGNSEAPKQSFATGGRLLLYAAPLAIAMWVFFPRIPTPFWAVPIDTSQAASGLSDTMSPGDITSLSMSGEVAFRVTFDGAVPPPRDRYWRGLVLTRFNGRTWTGREPSISAAAIRQISFAGEPISYEVTLEPTRQQWVFALDMPASWSLPQTFMGPQQQLARSLPIDQRVIYNAVSYSDYAVETELQAPFINWYSSLPENTNPRTLELARKMRAAARDEAGYIDGVLAMFNEQEFFYTLEPPPLGSNPVDRFLFETRRGFCEHYASAFAVLMRSAGIPTRIVLGYHGGEINPLGGHLIVRQSDAHAWTEVWLDGIGWRRVDPTAAVAPDRIDYGASDAAFAGLGAAWGRAAPSELLHKLSLTVDALSAKWNEWVLGYGPDTQNRFMEWLGMQNPDWQKMLLTLVAVIAGLIMTISGLLMLRYRAPQKDEAARLYARFVKKTGLEPGIGETPQRFAARAARAGTLPPPTIEAITNAYLDARYGTTSGAAIARLKTTVAAIA
jgi:transglutaminase-like putative cysteine protease